MSNYLTTNLIETRSTSVAPVFAGTFGSVCPQHATVTPMRKRTADWPTAANAHKGMGSVPWSHPTG